MRGVFFLNSPIPHSSSILYRYSNTQYSNWLFSIIISKAHTAPAAAFLLYSWGRYQVSSIPGYGSRNFWDTIKYQVYLIVAAGTPGYALKYQAYLNVAAGNPGDSLKYQAYLTVAAGTPGDF
jgi:hypothetical protein